MSSLNPNGHIQKRFWKTLYKYKDVEIEKAVEPIEKVENYEMNFNSQFSHNSYLKRQESNTEDFYGKDGKIIRRASKGFFSKKV